MNFVLSCLRKVNNNNNLGSINFFSSEDKSLFPFSAALHGQDLSNPDEDIEGVGVDADAVVDRVVLSGAVDGVVFGPVDDLLGVVQHEAAEQDQTSVEGEGVDAGTEGSSLSWKS